MKTQLISPFCPGSVLRNAIHLSYHFRQFHRTTFVPPFIPPSFYPVFAKPLLFSTFPLFPFFPFISKCPPFPFFPQSRSAREPRSARDRTGARRASEAQQNRKARVCRQAGVWCRLALRLFPNFPFFPSFPKLPPFPFFLFFLFLPSFPTFPQYKKTGISRLCVPAPLCENLSSSCFSAPAQSFLIINFNAKLCNHEVLDGVSSMSQPKAGVRPANLRQF